MYNFIAETMEPARTPKNAIRSLPQKKYQLVNEFVLELHICRPNSVGAPTCCTPRGDPVWVDPR